MKITAFVVDDEINIREAFIALVNRTCPDIQIIGESNNISDAYTLIKEKKPALVFLDIEMPGGNGFELLSRFEKVPFETVFVSSYGHYAIRALRLSALDYLLKPVLVDELVKIPERVQEAIQLKESAFKYKTLKTNLSDTNEEKKMVFRTKSRVFTIDITKIHYLQADSNYTYVFSETEKKFIHSKSLKEFEELLCDDTGNFIRIHKKFIVNINSIKTIERGNECFAILKDDTRVEVSRRKKQLLLERFDLS